MKNRPILCVILTVLMWPLCTTGQGWVTKIIDNKDGLSNDRITGVKLDTFGFIWVTTQHGLNRIAQNQVQPFRHNPYNENSPAANSMGNLYVCPNNRVWFGYAVGGIGVYDIKSGVFTHFDNLDFKKPGEILEVYEVLHYRKEQYFLYGNLGIFEIDLSTGKIDQLLVEHHHREFRDIFIQDEMLYVLGQDALIAVALIDNGAHIVFEKIIETYIYPHTNPMEIIDEEGHLYYFEDTEVRPTPHKFPPSMTISKISKSEYIGLSQEGKLFHYSGGTVDYFSQFPSFTFSIKSKFDPRIIYLFQSNKIFSIDIEQMELREMDSSPFPYLIFEEIDKNKVILATKNHLRIITPLSENSMPDEYVFSAKDIVYQDSTFYCLKNNGIYSGNGFSSLQIISRVNEVNNNQYEKLAISDSHIFVVSRGGYIVIDKHTGIVTREVNFEELLPYIYSVAVYSDQLFVGHVEGLCKYVKEGYEIIGLDNCYEIFIDTSDNPVLYFGTVRNGLGTLPLDSLFESSCVTYFQFNPRDNHFQTQTTMSINHWDKDHLLLGNYSAGILLFNKITHEMYPFVIDKDAIPPLVSDVENWRGTALGISESGLITIRNGIQSVDRDRKYDEIEILDGNVYFKTGHNYYKKFQNVLLIDTPSIIVKSINAGGKEEEFPSEFEADYRDRSIFLTLSVPDAYGNQKWEKKYRLLPQSQWNIINNDEVFFPSLSVGRHQIELALWNAENQQPLSKSIFSIRISPPWWRSLEMFFIYSLTSLFLLYVLYEWRMQIKMRKVRLLESLRQQTAQDFHDEIGNRLARIGFYTEILSQKKEPGTDRDSLIIPKLQENLASINGMMRDFIWALDPTKDSLFDLGLVIKDFADEIFVHSNIHFVVIPLDPSLSDYKVSYRCKKQVLLTTKEAITNIIKHASCDKVQFSLERIKNTALLKITDNGIGIQENNHSGSGITNMQNRMKSINGNITIQKNNPGTAVLLSFPFL